MMDWGNPAPPSPPPAVPSLHLRATSATACAQCGRHRGGSAATALASLLHPHREAAPLGGAGAVGREANGSRGELAGGGAQVIWLVHDGPPGRGPSPRRRRSTPLGGPGGWGRARASNSRRQGGGVAADGRPRSPESRGTTRPWASPRDSFPPSPAPPPPPPLCAPSSAKHATRASATPARGRGRVPPRRAAGARRPTPPRRDGRPSPTLAAPPLRPSLSLPDHWRTAVPRGQEGEGTPPHSPLPPRPSPKAAAAR